MAAWLRDEIIIRVELFMRRTTRWMLGLFARDQVKVMHSTSNRPKWPQFIPGDVTDSSNSLQKNLEKFQFAFEYLARIIFQDVISANRAFLPNRIWGKLIDGPKGIFPIDFHFEIANFRKILFNQRFASIPRHISAVIDWGFSPSYCQLNYRRRLTRPASQQVPIAVIRIGSRCGGWEETNVVVKPLNFDLKYQPFLTGQDLQRSQRHTIIRWAFTGCWLRQHLVDFLRDAHTHRR